MRSTLQALREMGVKLDVFLSSFTFKGDLNDIPLGDIMPFAHARVEMNLEEIFGPDGYVTVRAGGFATNAEQWKRKISAGEVSLHCSDAKSDYIVYGDSGRVCGKLLAHGQREGQSILYLYGPQLVAHEEAVRIIAKTLGKDVKTVDVDEEAAFQQRIDTGMPEAVARYILRGLRAGRIGDAILCEGNVGKIGKYLVGEEHDSRSGSNRTGNC